MNDVVDNEVVKNAKLNTLKTKVNSLEKKTRNATTLIHINQHITDKKKFREKNSKYWYKILDTSGLVTTTVSNTKISEVENKISYTRSLVTTTVWNTKISEVENKIPSASGLVKKTDYDAKIKELRENISLMLVIINLQVTYLM